MPLALMLLVALALAGCGGARGGKLAVYSDLDDTVRLSGDFDIGVYRFDNENNIDLLLIEGSVEQPTQAVHLSMYWNPVPGATPIDERSTNATVRYMIFTEGGVGVYGGAGFIFPFADPGGRALSADLRNTALRLLDASDGFYDRLGPAIATGEFTVNRDDLRARQILLSLQKQIRQRLGYPLFVQHDSPSPLAGSGLGAGAN